ncbi:uncharacterized protein EI90DRAFT_2915292 [Cantharellus anzutake]|uniref:uncharacterized protein n=1 Tax=Cantharellus anzutake TaxID=1750568 RepID=UPI0019070872|nr:uncharacterized protein EI90DRAFT_2915292 [Cantharellus anzutake]KAF8333959.1 hypothetical protein EI90DRAFT_2915292 [Cantharellus anzutake]
MPSSTPVIHQITVGGNSSLTFDPSNIAAQPNDIVQFTFVSKNHTITQSTFANPCVAGLKDGSPGFNSGFMPVAANSSNFPTFNVTVNNTSPIWGFCAQTGHCGKGMVFAINAPENGTNTFDAFRAAAVNGTTTTTSSEPSKPTTISTSSPSSSPRPSGGASSRYNIVSGGAGFVAMVFGAFLL